MRRCLNDPLRSYGNSSTELGALVRHTPSAEFKITGALPSGRAVTNPKALRP
jgi:hypothetical protein